MPLALGACATSTGPQTYPSTWPPLVAAAVHDGCPPLTGTYEDRIVGAHPQTRDTPRLSEVFARMGQGTGLTSPMESRRTWPVPTDVSFVQLILEPESLTVRFLSNTAPHADLSFRRHHLNLGEKRFDDLFTCYPSDSGSRLRFLAEPESHSKGMFPLYLEGGGTLVFLLQAADGSLVVQWRSESVAVSSLLVGSHVRVGSVWWRYAPVTPTR